MNQAYVGDPHGSIGDICLHPPRSAGCMLNIKTTTQPLF